MRAVTDDGAEIRFDRAEKPGVSNLLTIFSVLSGRTIESIEAEFAGLGYGHLKKAVAEVVEASLTPVRERTEELNEPGEVRRAGGLRRSFGSAGRRSERAEVAAELALDT